MKIKHKI